MWDLILKGGHVVDPLNNRNGVMDVAIENGKIAAVGDSLSGKARAVVDCEGRLVIPGIIDPHLHLGSVFGGPHGFRMAALSGVTTCLDMAGPLDDILAHGHTDGAGINVAIMDGFDPDGLYQTKNPNREQIKRYIDSAIEGGAVGVKLLGGHWPLDVEACRKTIELSYENKNFVAWHAGSLTSRSDLTGIREAVATADGLPLHLAHVNSYCRGHIKSPQEEADEAIDLLKKNPNIWGEAYLSALNGTNIDANDDGSLPDYVTRCCLEIFKLPVNKEGIRQAFHQGLLYLLLDTGRVADIWEGEKGLAQWEAQGCKGMGCFTVNPAVSRMMLCSAKRDDGSFVVDSISTDGGCVPRNVIAAMGLNLVKFGAITLSEVVMKSSLNAAKHLRLHDRGHFSEGAAADIAVVDFDRAKVVETYVNGCLTMKDGRLYGSGMTLVTTEKGVKAAKDHGYDTIVVDLSDLGKVR